MASTPSPSLHEALDRVKGEVGKRVNENVSSLSTNVQMSWRAAGKSLDSPVHKIGHTLSAVGRTVETLKANGADAVSSSVSGVVEDLRALCGNVERNVQALTSSGRGTDDLPSTPLASSGIASPISFLDMQERVRNPRAGKRAVPRPLPSSSTAPSSISSEESYSKGEVPEDTPHPDLSSVNASSVFSIGYVGPPLLEPAETERFASIPNKTEQGPSEIAASDPILRFEGVRKSIGEALVLYHKIRSLGLRESSWETKMPWHNPPPARLSKAVSRPPQKFSSRRERHAYHKRVRRRGRYWISGPLPGWSWFAADVILLYFLTSNPAANFLL